MIYFDNASSTKPSETALKVFFETSEKFYFNPNSIHKYGMKEFNEIKHIKDKILSELKLDSTYDVLFTSGATESNNLAIRGYCLKNKGRGNHIRTTKIEHETVLNVFKNLEDLGFKVTYLDINSEGKIDIENFKKIMDKDTILVSIMPVNNEVGNALNIKDINEIVKNYPKCVLHCDCAQTLGKYDFNYKLADLITISAHKIYGIKGIGALIKKKKIMLEPIHYGGGQENGLRSGTSDYPAIASFFESIKEVNKEFKDTYKKVTLIHDYLVEELSKLDNIKLHLYKDYSPYILNFSLLNKKASVIVEALSNEDILVSSVSACNSKKEEPSYVLLALGNSLLEAKNAIRISLGKYNTLDEAKEFVSKFKEILERVRG